MIRIALHKTLKGEGEMLDLQLNLKIEPGSIVAIYGDSGAGKTTFLRLMAGLTEPDDGSIELSESWYDKANGICLPTRKRKIGYMFQDYALFPHMSVEKNLLFALEKGQDRQRVTDLISMTELLPWKDRLPSQLSGGQQQRVALARALVRKPELLLLDEPYSALDHSMRRKLQDHLLRAREKDGFTTFMVTHDLSEIFRIADQVVHLSSGKVLQYGKPEHVFSSTSTVGKFRFTGEIIDIRKEDVIYVISVLIGNQVTKVVADPSEAAEFSLGDRVLVASKAFNPLIQKIR